VSLANANPLRNFSAKKPPLARMLVSNSSAYEGRRGRLAQSRDRPQPTVLVGTMRKSERNPLNRGWRAGNANVDDGRRTMRAAPGKESCVARASREASRNRSMAPATAKRSCVFNLLYLQKKSGAVVVPWTNTNISAAVSPPPGRNRAEGALMSSRRRLTPRPEAPALAIGSGTPTAGRSIVMFPAPSYPPAAS
jgi:hypothetical protein